MDLTAGRTLLHYRLTTRIGAGGMGEVWQAADTTLGREVAIKILPAAFAADAERLARFEREAKVLASLNHPGIAGIYGLHECDGVRFLALELVPGDDLAERLRNGALPLAEAIDVARQIAEALEVAHEQGIVHRDLKPANVKRTLDGKVKVLDFGLAKPQGAAKTSGGARDASQSPTVTSFGSEAGLLLGTAAYMSPEQARGKAVDKRADIWAFGCVLYEMLSGRRAFEGDTVSDTLAAVLMREADLAALPSAVPEPVRALLRRCLDKDPKRRLRDIGDARFELEERATARPVVPVPRARPFAFIALAVAAGAIALAVWALARMPPVVERAPLTRLEIGRPAGSEGIGPGSFAIAPDGSAVVFVVTTSAGASGLWIRDLDAREGHAIAGTDDATFPFWSPDSRHLAFFAGGRLKRVPRSGGAVQPVCDAPGGRGGAWSPAGVIVFAPNPRGPLSKVDASGGVPETATILDAKRSDTSHRFPCFLPDGRHFIYTTEQVTMGQVSVASLDDPHGRPLLVSGLAPRYVEPGFLLFTRDQALLAQRIDLATLTMVGRVVPLAERPDVRALPTGTPPIDVARNGTLVYDAADDRPTDVVRLGRDGRPTGTLLRHAGVLVNPALSHDGRRLAVIETAGAGSVLWTVDVDRGTELRLSPSDRGVAIAVWTADDRRLVTLVTQKDTIRIDLLDAQSGAEQIARPSSAPALWPKSAAPDGTIVFDAISAGSLWDIVSLKSGDGGGEGEPRPYLATSSNENAGEVSPDGRYLSYVSDASGRRELYLDRFPAPGGPVRVSSEGSGGPSWWRDDGRELLFLSASGRALLACDVRTTPTIEVGKPRVLFEIPEDVRAIVPSPHGDGFYLLQAVGSRPTTLVVVQNWTAQLDGQE